MSTKHIDALKLALEALERHAELGLLAGSTITAIREALVDSALDRMAENARELGLDYEPPCKTGSQCTSKCQQCEQPAQQQEPMAWMDGYRNIYSLEEKAAGCPEATIALVPMANHKKTSGSPINEIQCVCGAVWLGEEMVHLPDKRPPASKPFDTHAAPGQSFDTHSRTPQPSKPLTDEEIMEMYNEPRSDAEMIAFARAIEAKLRGKNA